MGQLNKQEYFLSQWLELVPCNNIFTFSDCPAPPLACEGNIDDVNAYFLRNSTIMAVLDKLVEEKGLDSRFDLVKNLDFTYHYTDEDGETQSVTKSGAAWGEARVLPYSERDNAVPWVIVYEPTVCVHLAGEEAQLLLTATEMALAQGILYNWHTVGSDSAFVYTWKGIPYLTSKIKPQCVQSLAFKNLPASVSLEYPWFGFDTIDKPDGEFWSTTEVLNCGGWGMGFLTARPEDEPLPSSSLTISAVKPNSSYERGAEVISSFIVQNDYGRNVFPSDRLSLNFTVRNSSSKIIYTETSDYLALPDGEDEYVWFRWRVPADVLGRVACSAEFVSDGIRIPAGTQAASFENALRSTDTSRTAEPKFNDTVPNGFPANEPYEYSFQTQWHYWKYENGSFTKISENATLDASLAVTPDPSIATNSYSGGVWTMRSGYGVELSAEAILGGSFSPGSVTGAQTAFFTYPEFLWTQATGGRDTAELTAGHFVLRRNPSAENRRIHYVPLWYPDGDRNYRPAVVLSDCWTPGGMLSACRLSAGISISGSLYDDWYISH